MALSEEQTRRRQRRAARKAAEAGDVGSVPDARATRPRRSAASRVFYSLFVIFAVAGLTALVLAAFGYQQYIATGPLPAGKVAEVRKGLRTPEIADDLEQAGVISDANLFTAAAYLTGSRGRLKAGEYEFDAGMSMRDVLGLVVQGKSIVYKLTIPEGWTTEQALDRVRQNDVLTGDLTVSAPEGGLFPDTYLFRRGETRDSVVQGMVAAQQKLIAELWEKRSPDLPVKSVNEAVTLASIVEKETALAEERPRVAAVFANRLKQRMRLQSDPTIIYGLVAGKGKLDRPLTKQDIAQKTPYNTYRIDGLPPGPISNPGRAALEAVLHSPVSTDLYFVADGTGGHAFAATLDDHKKNVAKWREIERNRNAADAIDELAAEKSGEPVEPKKPVAAAAAAAKAPDPQVPPKPPVPSEPQIPEGTAVTEPTGPAASGEQKIVTPELPAVEEEPAQTEAAQPDAADPEMADDGTATANSAIEPPKPAGEPPAEAKPETKSQPLADTAIAQPPAAADDAAAKPEPPAEAKAEPEPTPQEDAETTTPPAAADDATQPEAAVAAAQTIAVPLPRQKPRQAPKPGDLFRLADRLVPIPVPKPRLQ